MPDSKSSLRTKSESKYAKVSLAGVEISRMALAIHVNTYFLDTAQQRLCHLTP